MAKSDLLKQAIADANAVKETALANAKIALQEAFAPRLERMLSTKLSEELEDEEPVEDDSLEMGDDVTPIEDEDAMGGMPDAVGVGLDFDQDGDYDLSGVLGGEEEEALEEPAVGVEDENPEDEYNEGYMHSEEDLELESIIRELEGDLEEPVASEDEEMGEGVMMGHEDEEDEMLGEDIDSIIEAILREDEMMAEPEAEDDDVEALKTEVAEKEEELQEAYRTVKQLKSIINEVNLLNAKLLYTNKLFRNFELNESQKMKVIENFDRAGNTREVKLVFSTLAESFNRPATKKRVVKESYASKPTQTTAPKSAPILNEGFELANRWKKLAGLL
jgi:hypothetical protein